MYYELKNVEHIMFLFLFILYFIVILILNFLIFQVLFNKK